MRTGRRLLAAFLSCMLWVLPAAAGIRESRAETEAAELTADCTLEGQNGKRTLHAMTDRKYDTYYTIGKGKHLEITCEESIGGVFLQWFDRPSACQVQVQDGESWTTAAEGGEHFLSEWFPLPKGARKVRIVNAGKGRMYLAELTVYGMGAKPAGVPVWRLAEKTDLMVMVAHPDDELLWFGGLLPTYAGQRGLDVTVAYLVPTTPLRRLELLDGLWTCGVTIYPAFGDMRDVRSDTLKGQYKLWNKKRLQGQVVEILRQYKPDVLVTHDFSGEYGHGAHRAVADAAASCVKLAADPRKFAPSAKKWGAWQVSKVYVHLYEEDALKMDWHQPLPVFGGEDGLAVAVRAFACHKSQQAHGWAMEDGGKYDNSRFGLYFTAVGEDTRHDDFMENIASHDADPDADPDASAGL